ncbi:unnamed protein product [Bemisia tabaci]|uniref:Uncharacterized protein n=1 Tax=Bemisia tabaci TaxID=7038 RepID=A0A9P0A9N4_BEMTA|nr:unnamed protein product [Bemisia tabaci]
MEVAQIGQDHDVEEVSRNRQHRNCGPRSDRKVNTLTPQYLGYCSTQWLLISINWIPSLFAWDFCTPSTERRDVEGAHYSKQPDSGLHYRTDCTDCVTRACHNTQHVDGGIEIHEADCRNQGCSTIFDCLLITLASTLLFI